MCLVTSTLLPSLLYGADIVEVPVDATTTYCAEIKCVKVAPGKVGLYLLQNHRNPLAFATLAEQTDFGGIQFYAGQGIRFSDPEQNDSYNSNFSMTFDSTKKLAGIEFDARSEIKFSRFSRRWSSPQGMYIFDRLPEGLVTIHGTIADATATWEGVVLKAKTSMVFATKVPLLQESSPNSNTLIAGTVGENSIYHGGKAAIPVPAETLIDVQGDFVSVWGEQYLKAFGVTVNVVQYGKNTGVIKYIAPSMPVKINNVVFAPQRYMSGISFYDTGSLKKGTPIKQNQIVNDILVDGLVGANGPLLFYDNGIALAIETTNVDANRKFLSPEFLRILPNNLDPRDEQMWFLFNPKGELRAITVMLAPFHGGPIRDNYLFLVNGNPTKYTFTDVTKVQNALSAGLAATTGGSIPDVVRDYLSKN